MFMLVGEIIELNSLCVYLVRISDVIWFCCFFALARLPC